MTAGSLAGWPNVVLPPVPPAARPARCCARSASARGCSSATPRCAASTPTSSASTARARTRTCRWRRTEHIISERLLATLPDDERPRWHPHNFELAGGSLIAPGLPERVERVLMASLANSYGKTWHVWHTGRHDEPAAGGDPLPYGDAMLMWSFNRDGEADPRMERSRDEAFGVSTLERRQRRLGLAHRMRPQEGVDAMAGAFGEPVPTPPPGVLDTGRPGRWPD